MRSLPAPLAACLALSVSGVLLCPALTGRAGSQTVAPPATKAAVSPLFRPFLSRLRSTAHIPILLPPNIPGQTGPLVADLGVGGNQYTVTVYRAKAGQRLDFSNQVAAISGGEERRQYPLAGKPVALAAGMAGRYLGARKAAPYAFLQWHQSGCVYEISLLHGTQAQLRAMADGAIRHPLVPAR